MNVAREAWDYINQPEHWAELGLQLRQHLILVAVSLALALLIGLPLGIWCARSRRVAGSILNTVNALRVIPSLAVMFIAIKIPGLGLTVRTAILALTLLALPPIVINTDAAYRGISAAIIEAAQAMGMNARQRFWTIETPLALPIIVAGIRTALVEVIASATLAAYIGAGGLGDFITLGISLNRPAILLVGAVPIALLAVLAETILFMLQRWIQSPLYRPQ